MQANAKSTGGNSGVRAGRRASGTPRCAQLDLRRELLVHPRTTQLGHVTVVTGPAGAGATGACRQTSGTWSGQHSISTLEEVRPPGEHRGSLAAAVRADSSRANGTRLAPKRGCDNECTRGTRAPVGEVVHGAQLTSQRPVTSLGRRVAATLLQVFRTVQEAQLPACLQLCTAK